MSSTVLDQSRLSQPHDVLREAVERGDVPGAVALVRQGNRTLFHEAVGFAALEPRRLEMHRDTVFDLASLTKPLATTPVILHLVETGKLDLDQPVERYLPEIAGTRLGNSTPRALLTHSSGLPAWYAVYSGATDREDALRVIAGLPFSYDPGTKVEYSCLGFITLGLLAERLAGRPLDELAHAWVFQPLGLRSTGYRPQLPPEQVAWTERGTNFEKGTMAGMGISYDRLRTDFHPGQVHDGNAWYAMEGVSGNAGLFSTAEEVGILGQLWLNGGIYDGVRILREETVEEALVDYTPELEERRGLGWLHNRPSDAFPRSAGSLLSARTFGHTGFTGTSIWIDRDRDLVAVLLMNRVHPVADDSTRSIAVRHHFHDALVQALDAAV